MDSETYLEKYVDDLPLRDMIQNLFYATGIERNNLRFIVENLWARENYYGLDTMIGFATEEVCYMNLHVLTIERNVGRVYVDSEKLIEIIHGLSECCDVEEWGL